MVALRKERLAGALAPPVWAARQRGPTGDLFAMLVGDDVRSLKLSGVLISFVLVRDSLPRLLRFDEGDFFLGEVVAFIRELVYLECAGRAQRRRRFRAHDDVRLSDNFPRVRKPCRVRLATAVQKLALMRCPP